MTWPINGNESVVDGSSVGKTLETRRFLVTCGKPLSFDGTRKNPAYERERVECELSVQLLSHIAINDTSVSNPPDTLGYTSTSHALVDSRQVLQVLQIIFHDSLPLSFTPPRTWMTPPRDVPRGRPLKCPPPPPRPCPVCG